MDERPLKADNEINPDVLGYIFEKYVNQKQMGAYYSKEDITGYISQNTVIPYLFDQARKGCKIAFEGEHTIWRLLQADPDRYIYRAVKKGVHFKLPPEIAAGLNDVSKRTEWNKAAHEEHALPTELWREVVGRRKRYEEVRAKLVAGDIRSINELITYNLDIRQFAQDVIESSEGPELLRAFYKAIKNVSVLDPACGSGAFLFAALNILESLYEACLDRMEAFLNELERSRQKHRPEKFDDFRKELERVAEHPNRKYFIYKTIIVNNLFGVDIMEEATEICKLRLFLKLVAQIERLGQIEPLPDIDFNIRAGNSLIGYTNLEQVRKGMPGNLFVKNEMERILVTIKEKAEEIDRLFALFREMQSDQRMESKEFSESKQELIRRLRVLEDELNPYLSGEYGIKPSDSRVFRGWLESHKPFHWFIEFYGIMKDGGFDVVLGNPPYVEYAKISSEYTVRGYGTEPCSNLFAFFVERSSTLLRDHGRFGMIIPMSAVSTERMAELRSALSCDMRALFCSNYSGDAHPSILFTGVKMRLTIVVSERETLAGDGVCLSTTGFLRWYAEARPQLFESVRYIELSKTVLLGGLIPKIASALDLQVLDKLGLQRSQLGHFVIKESPHSVYAHRIVAHFVKCFDFVPYFRNDRDGVKRSEDYKVFSFRTGDQALLASAVLNSTLFYYFYLTYSDAYHCGRELILQFPCDLSSIKKDLSRRLIGLNEKLMDDLRTRSVRRKIRYHGTGWIEYDEFYPRLSKSLIDEIDRALAAHYGLTDEELDFILHYDLKYRMGEELEEAED